MRFVCFATAAFLIATTAAQAADKRDCNGTPSADDLSNFALGVVAVAKANFVANETDKAGCPSDGAACQRKAFVLQGNNVLFDNDDAGKPFVCASFVGPTGRETDGWLPAAALKTVTPAPNWIGTWKRDTSGEIDIKKKSATVIDVSGEATWGEGGGTHVGGISADLDPRKVTQGFGTATDGETQTVWGKGDKDQCAVMLKQLGPYLIANDNSNCGGANVSFAGVYVRK